MTQKSEKEYKSKADSMKDGTFAEFYNGNPESKDGTFLKVKQALGIDKVLFAFVIKNTNGKGVNVFVEPDEFDNFCDDILNYVIKKKLVESDGKKLDVWTYTTGTKGSKRITFGKGKNGNPLFHAYDSETRTNVNVSVTYDALRSMAKWWKRISPLYYNGLINVCLGATKTYNLTDEDIRYSKEEIDAQETSQNTTPEKAPEKEVVKEVLELTGTAACRERKAKPGDYAMTCKGKDNRKFNVVFHKDVIDALGQEKWSKFVERSTDLETPVFFKGEFVKGKENDIEVFYFQNFIK